jgi:hypothetical protein
MGTLSFLRSRQSFFQLATQRPDQSVGVFQFTTQQL